MEFVGSRASVMGCILQERLFAGSTKSIQIVLGVLTRKVPVDSRRMDAATVKLAEGV
jgi:hypothetical protein